MMFGSQFMSCQPTGLMQCEGGEEGGEKSGDLVLIWTNLVHERD
jgi:hypothetical protein